MEVKRNIGSAHIIDGEKVSVKYQGQIKTCNKCHQEATTCPGKSLARDCSSQKILLSEHMTSYWKSINFEPETREMNRLDLDENDDTEDKTETADQVKGSFNKVNLT